MHSLKLLSCLALSIAFCVTTASAKPLTEEEAQIIGERCIKTGCGKTAKLRSKTARLKSRMSLLVIKRGKVKANKSNIDGLLGKLGAKMSKDEIRIILNNGVLFAFDRSDLRPDAIITMNKVLEVLEYKEFQTERIAIEGHTDWIGSEDYNLKLSRKRAKSVVQWLVKNGVSKRRLSSTGYGESQPIETNETDEGRQKNRRVEITIERRGQR